MTTLNHSQLGDIKGLKHDDKGVAQYLGIQYATIAHRFAAPQLRTDYGGTIDATRRGPPVVRSPVAVGIEFSLIQKSLDIPEYPPVSDLNGLNLDITIPQQVSANKDAKFPVLVFIHGGAYLMGDSGAPHQDMGAFVAYSQSIGKPVVGVSINYRLGVAGFLDSNELRALGAPANRGLLDQKTAFQWLRRHIGGFSGDPTRITAIGQSAGASSVMNLLDLESEDTLFDRAICLSGNNLAVPVCTKSAAQDAYKSVLECLAIDSTLSSEDQVKALIATSAEDILSKVSLSIIMTPVKDKDDEVPSFGTMEAYLASRQYKTPLMAGSTDFDAVIFQALGILEGREQGALARDFVKYLADNVPSTHRVKLESLVSLYNISATDNNDEETVTKIVQFATDLTFYATTKYHVSYWPTQSWMYYLNESNPWEGPYQGRSSHCLDTAYLFLNFSGVMNESQKKTAGEFARDVIEFTYGGSPWGEYHASGDMKVYGTPGKGQAPSQEVQDLWKEIGLDNLFQGWHAFFAKS
ncbi:hypothetical protein HYE68_002977 [Fusarium pseudograminearum]|nr:hypothetical protein HYE68_002977 [Fusarium pseudograminearum]